MDLQEMYAPMRRPRGGDSGNPLAALSLERLGRLLKRERVLRLSGTDEHALLIVKKAIFATLIDCKDLGAGQEAARLVDELRGPRGNAVPTGGV